MIYRIEVRIGFGLAGDGYPFLLHWQNKCCRKGKFTEIWQPLQAIPTCETGNIKKAKVNDMEKIKEIISASISTKQQVLQDETLLATIEQITNVMAEALQSGKRIYFCGNGGSAADAQHLAAEFTGRFYLNRKAIPAEALHCNVSYMTAVANDYNFDVVYSRLVEGICEVGDVLVGLSTSGNSANIVKAFESAKAMGVLTVGFTGITGGVLKGLSDFLVNVPSSDTPRIQESHIMIGHIICQLVEERLFPPTDSHI